MGSLTLRKRCLVLRQIEHLKGHATLDTIGNQLPELTRQDVQKSIYNLLTQDRIVKAPAKVVGESGRPQFSYVVNDDWESAKKRAKRRNVAGRKTFSGELQTNTTRALGTVRFRDRKVKLLLKLIKHTQGTDRDLLIGLLADLGHKVKP